MNESAWFITSQLLEVVLLCTAIKVSVMKKSKTCLKHMVSYCHSHLAMIDKFLLFLTGKS